jgi:hypothetical protein
MWITCPKILTNWMKSTNVFNVNPGNQGSPIIFLQLVPLILLVCTDVRSFVFPYHKSIAKGITIINLDWFYFMNITYLLLNFGVMLSGYFALQKKLHTNSEGKSSRCNMSSSKEQNVHHWIEELAQKYFLSNLRIFIVKKMRNSKENNH